MVSSLVFSEYPSTLTYSTLTGAWLVTRKSIPMQDLLSLSVSLKTVPLTRRLEILAISSLALADGLSYYSSFTVLAFRANSSLPLMPLEFVLAATWLSALSGCLWLQSWLRLKLLNPMRLCCLRPGDTSLPVKLSCELFYTAFFAIPLCERHHRHTIPFNCSIKPRSRMSLDLIKSLRQRDSEN